jgi:hypothetical protein
MRSSGPREDLRRVVDFVTLQAEQDGGETGQTFRVFSSPWADYSV